MNDIPSKDPASDGSLGGMLQSVFKKMLQRVDGMLPATVVSYNRVTGRAVIQPSIDMTTTDGTRVKRATYASIQVLALGGGGFDITFPLQPGDTGWIEASDRDISLWQQAAGARNVPANTERLHSFSDGRFIPDVLAKYTLPAGRESDMVIQSRDGSVYVALSADTVRIKAPTVRVEAETLIRMQAPTISFNASTVLQFNAPAITGGASGGTTAFTGVVTFNGIPFNTHRHTGVDTGSGTSEGPVA